MPNLPRPFLILVFTAALAACGGRERAAGERAPLSADCERLDGTRCMLPWPSSTYTVKDPTTATGVRLSVNWRSLPVIDKPDALNRLDGFSVATPLAVGFPVPIDHRLEGQRPASGFRLFVATPGALFEKSVPIRLGVIPDKPGNASLLIGYPMRAMAYDTDYLAVVLDEVKADDGTALTAPDSVKIALGLAPAATEADKALVAYHAPTRRMLKDLKIDPAHVLRVFDFNTRSAPSVSDWLGRMRGRALEAVDAGTVTVTVTSVVGGADAGSLEVMGGLTGVPGFVTDAGTFALDGGQPLEQGPHVVPFRALIPAGTGTYPMVVYGHGTGGKINETTFDKEILGAGAGKLSIEFYGWTDATTITTLTSFQKPLSATERSTAGLLQAMADASALEAALSTVLGDALAAPLVGGAVNPASGRRSDPTKLVYAGGSLGGTMGLVHATTEPGLKGAVLNVPGAAWTHFAAGSQLWSILDSVFAATTPSALDRALGLTMTQALWDPVDGAAWNALPSARPCVSLLQESMGDPVLPNIGSAFAAQSVQATQVGAVLDPLEGLPNASSALGKSGITQYRVPASVTGPFQIHGFGAQDTPAGVAAREQIFNFLKSVWAGAPDIEIPPTCLARPNSSCDFSTP